MSDKQSMSDVLRKAIVDSGLPYLRIEQETGVLRQSIMKFLEGKSLRLDIADKLADYFGLELTKRKGK